MNQLLFTMILILLQPNCQNTPPDTTTNYQITRRISLEGDGFWDYLVVDDVSNRLYVSHGTRVHVVDLNTGKQAGQITPVRGVHGIALVPALHKGYISCGRSNSVVIFNPETFEILDSIKTTGNNPDAIIYEAYSKHILTMNHSGDNATVIDPVTDEVVGTIELPGSPEAVVTDGAGTIYVNIEDKSLIAKIDVKKMEVTATWPLEPGEEPTGLALDSANHRFFASCDKLMVVVDAGTGKVLQTLPIGDHADGVAYDPDLKLAFSSNGEGTLTVVDASGGTCQVLQNFPTQAGARTIALDKQTHKLYVPTSELEETPGTNGRRAAKPGTFVVLEIAL